MTNKEIESCIQTLRFLENTFLDDHGIFLNDKHPDNIEKIIIFLHESSVTPKGVTVTDFADRCRECGAEYEKLLEASKPKPGHWISHNEHCEELGVKPSGLGAYAWCSNCDCGVDIDVFHRNHYNFCPNCGADMRVTIESEDKK